jgi:hypothetical protein
MNYIVKLTVSTDTNTSEGLNMNNEKDSKFQIGDRVRVEFEGIVREKKDDGTGYSIDNVDYGCRGAFTSELTLIEPAYTEPELRSGDRVAPLNEPDDTDYWFQVYKDVDDGTIRFRSNRTGIRSRRDSIPERIRVLPPVPGSREAELARRIERAVYVLKNQPFRYAGRALAVLRGEA